MNPPCEFRNTTITEPEAMPNLLQLAGAKFIACKDSAFSRNCKKFRLKLQKISPPGPFFPIFAYIYLCGSLHRDNACAPILSGLRLQTFPKKAHDSRQNRNYEP